MTPRAWTNTDQADAADAQRDRDWWKRTPDPLDYPDPDAEDPLNPSSSERQPSPETLTEPSHGK